MPVLQQILNGIHLGNEPRHDNDFLPVVHRRVDDVGQGIQLGFAHGMGVAVIISEETARQLGEPQELGQHIHRRHLAVSQFCVGFLFEVFVNFGGLRLQCDGADFLGDFRQIQTFVLGNSESDGMEPSEKVLAHGFLEHGDIAAVARHVEKDIPKCVKATAEDGLIKEAILAEHVQFPVCDDRPGQEQLVPCLVPQVVHRFRLRRASFLEFVSLIGDDEVGIVGQQLIFEPPCALVVHHHNL